MTGTCKSNNKGGIANAKFHPAKLLSQFRKIICGSWRGKTFGGLGWLLALVLSCWAAPRIYHRLFTPLPGVQREHWRQTLGEKERELSLPWRDSRPLIILAGDSHVELGDWYDLFAGGWAVRNCGLARAKIADAAQLVSAIGNPPPQMVVLMCGINDLGAGRTPEACLHDYELLLAGVRSHLKPQSIMVLSVMPLRESVVDRASHAFNVKVNEFNAAVKARCQQRRIIFLNVNSAVMDADGGLAAELTADGLHLNPAGYRRLADVIAARLRQVSP